MITWGTHQIELKFGELYFEGEDFKLESRVNNPLTRVENQDQTYKLSITVYHARLKKFILVISIIYMYNLFFLKILLFIHHLLQHQSTKLLWKEDEKHFTVLLMEFPHQRSRGASLVGSSLLIDGKNLTQAH